MRVPHRILLVVASLLLLCARSLQAQVYISEFVADNQVGTKVDEDGDHSDWLEIWNAGTSAVSLNGWYLTDTSGDLRKWRFPVTSPAVTLAAKARLVVFCSAKDRKLNAATLHTNFKLSKNAGSYLALVQADGLTVSYAYANYPRQVQDVPYGIPSSVTTQTLVAAGATGKVKVPLSDADMPTGAAPGGWNTIGFDDSNWTTGASGFGYDTANTYGSLIGAGGNLQAVMYNVNSSALIRMPFNVSNPGAVTGVKLSMKYDDGFLCYLNGTLIFSSLATTPSAWNSSAIADRSEASTSTYQVFSSTSAQALLVAGANVLSFQMLNFTNGSTEDTDIQGTPNGSRALCLPLFEVTVDGGIGAPTYLASATPGAANSSAITSFGPLITQTTDSAPRPSGTATSAPIVVSAKVVPSLNPLNATNPVLLKYRLMQGSEQSIVMKDDGIAPDLVAGDSVYTAQFPTANAGAGQMFRWKVEAKDSVGAIHTEPPYLDSTDNDQYYGTVTADGITTSSLPIMHWFVLDAAASRTSGGTRCALYFLDHFYDNVYVNLHGQSSAGFPVNKKSENFNFSEDNRFLWKVGENRERAVNLITTWADKSHVRDTLAWETWANTGHLASHWAQLVRVQQNGAFFGIYDMVENGDVDFVEREGLDGNGALYKMYNDLSSVSGNEKKTRDGDLTTTDLQALVDGLGSTWTAATLPARRLFAYDNVDIPSLVNCLATNVLITNNDFGHKNYYLYRDTNGTREWSILPWDEDLSYGHTWTSSQGYFNDDLDSQRGLVLQNVVNNRLVALIMKSAAADTGVAPEMAQMFLRRLRTLMDTFLVSPTTNNGPLEQRINQMLDAMDPPGVAFLTDADRDLQLWGYWVDGSGNPLGAPAGDAATHDHGVRKSAARVINSNPAGIYPQSTSNAEGLGDTTPAYLTGRRAKLYNGGLTLNGQPIPAVQPVTPTGLVIEYVDANPGNQNQEFFVIRNNSGSYVDISGWKITGAVDYTFRGGTVIPPFTSNSAVNATGDVHTGRLHVARNPFGFRSRTVSPKGGEYRLVTGPYSGQLSARGETINLVKPGATPALDVIVATNTYTANPTPAQNFLRVTELNFSPLDPTPAELQALPGVQAGDFEFIELVNSGPTALNLGGASFDKGVTFTFPANFTLQSNQRCVIAALASAFTLRYGGSGATLAGQYDGHLSNTSESLELLDSVGEVILDFTYDTTWFGLADPADPSGAGLLPVKGYSLVTRTGTVAYNAYDAPTSWALSGTLGGTPGATDSAFSNVFTGWRKDFFTPAEESVAAVAGANADDDHDGRTNFEEFAWGGNPRVPDAKPVTTTSLVQANGQTYFAITFNRRHNALDVIYTVEVSSDLVTWTPVNFPVGSPTLQADGTEAVTYRDNVPAGDTPRFIRVRAVR